MESFRAIRGSGWLFFALGIGAAAPACSGGTLGTVIRPEEKTGSEALREPPCRAPGPHDQPLIVDWKAHERANLEEAMADGVAVVAHDCTSLRLLRGCTAEGSYGFFPTSKKEEVVTLTDGDEVRANFPAFGPAVAKELSADFARGATIDIGLAIVGKLRTTKLLADRATLRGGAACDGATHLVRGVFVGAFAMATGSRGHLGAAAHVFAASSTSTSATRYRDGDLAACGQATSGASAPPSACAAALRLELAPVLASAAATAAPRPVDPPPTCPEGLVLSGGKCAPATSVQAHACKPTDSVECTEQCSRGDLQSCTSLGDLLADGTGVPKDPERAMTHYQKACDGQHAAGCHRVASALFFGKDKASAGRASTAAQQACSLGSSAGCNLLALMYSGGWGVEQSRTRAAELYQRTCDGGNPVGCTGLGSILAAGEGVPRDEARAAALYKRACDGDEQQACGNLGVLYEEGRGVPVDPTKAAALHRKACAQGPSMQCEKGVCAEKEHWSCDRLRKLEGR